MSVYRSKMMISLGSVITAPVDIQTVIPTSKSSVHLLCPTHTKRLSQYYQCEEGEQVLRMEAVKGLETPEGWKIQTEPLPLATAEKTIGLTPVPLSELQTETFEGSSIYYLVPSAAASNQVWQVLTNIVKKGKVALIAKLALGSNQNEKLWRLDLFQGYLVMRELVYPEKINSAPEIPDGKVDKQITTLVDQFVENLMSSWSKFDSSDSNQKRFDAWIQEGKTVEGDNVQVKDVSVVPLLDSLQQAVADTKRK